ncbi:MAG: hypothetical protein LBP76_07675, partial [Treponema sp.]|nr:hypothetical protein [Treponema sp.]
ESGRDYQPESAGDEQKHNAEMQALKNAFSHQNWINAGIQVAGGKNIAETTKRFIRGQVRNNPLPYMEAWAVISGDTSWLPAESEAARLSRLDRGREVEIENASPEELRRIARTINYEGVKQDIENGTLKAGDPRMGEYEEEARKRKNEIQKKIDAAKEELSDYEELVKNTEEAIKKEQQFLDQLERNTTPEGLTATRKQLARIKDLERKAREIRIEYNNYIKNQNETIKRNFRDLRNLRNQLYETEKELKAINEWREIRKKMIRSVARPADTKTIHIGQVQQIRAIQAPLFRDMYKTVPKFIGPKAKNIKQLIADFISNEDYRRELEIRLNPSKFAQIERIVFRDLKTREVRPYQDITKAQRNRLYKLLLENEQLFKDLGLDVMQDPGKVDPRALENLKDIVPADILYKLEHLSLAEWTIEDMETLAGVVSELRRKGREELKIKLEARRKLVEDYRSRLDKQIRRNMKTGGDDDEPIQGVASTKNKEEKRAARWKNIYNQMNPRRFFRMLDGGRDELFYSLITQGEYRAYDEKMRRVVERREKVNAALKEIGIKPKELWTNTFEVQGINGSTDVTLDEMLFFHRAALNDRAWNAVVFGNFATVDEKSEMSKITDVTDMLSLEQRAIMRYNAAMAQLEEFLAKNEKFRQVEEIIGRDYDDNYERLNTFIAAEFNQDLGSEDYYMPLGRTEVTGEPKEQQTVNEALAAAGISWSIEKGFTKNRVDISPANQTPVRAGLYKTWDQMVDQQEQLMAYQPYLREIRQIFDERGSKVLMNNVKKKYSLAANEYIKNYISDIANPKAAKAYADADFITRLIRGHYPTAVLAWRLSSIIKQVVTSPAPFFQYVNPVEYIGAAAQCLSEETRAMILEKSIYMKTRVYDPAVDMINEVEKYMLEGPLGKVETALSKVEKTGMKGLEWIDYVCVAPGWLAAYNRKLVELSKNNNGMSDAVIDAEAVRFADQVVRDTQPSSNPMDLAPIFKGERGFFKQLFLQFQVPMSVIFQNIVFDAPAAVRQGRIFQAITTIGIYALTAAVVGAMGEEDDDEKLDPKERGIDALGGLIESIPMWGGGAANAVESLLRTGKIQPSFNNYFPVAGSAQRTVNALSDKNWSKAALQATDALFYMTGLPAGLKREIEKAAEEGDWEGMLILLGIK